MYREKNEKRVIGLAVCTAELAKVWGNDVVKVTIKKSLCKSLVSLIHLKLLKKMICQEMKDSVTIADEKAKC